MKSSRKFKICRTSSRLKIKSRRIRRRRRGGMRIPINEYIKTLKDDAEKSGFLKKRVTKFYGIFGHATSLPADNPDNYFKLTADLLFLTPYGCSLGSTVSPHLEYNRNSTQNTLTRAYRRVYSLDTDRNGESFLRFLNEMIHPIGYSAEGKTTLEDIGKYSATSELRLHRPPGDGKSIRILDTQVLGARQRWSSNGMFEGIIEFDLTNGTMKDVTGEFFLTDTTRMDTTPDAAAKIQANTPYQIPEGYVPSHVWNTRDPQDPRRYEMITIKSLMNIDPKYKDATFVSFGCRAVEPGVDTATTPRIVESAEGAESAAAFNLKETLFKMCYGCRK